MSGAAWTDAVVLDGGQSGCRGAVARHGQVHGPVGCGPASPAPSRDHGSQRIAESAAAALADAGVEPAGRPLAAGLTGLGENPQEAANVAAALRDRLGVTGVRLAGDLVTAHLGALGGGAGVVVAAGTGAVTLAVAEDGTTARVDGWGYLIGDRGSGFAVGQAGLRAAMAAFEGRGGSLALRQRAEARFGWLGALPARLHREPDPAGPVAAFATDVADAARRGDVVAEAIWRSAARDLADSVVAAAEQAIGAAAPVAVAVTGGLFRAVDLLRDPFSVAVCERLPSARLVEAAGTALDGAARLAWDPGPLAALITYDDPGP